MASSSIALFLSLAMVGVEGEGVLKGEVVALDGRGISGVALMAAGEGFDGSPPTELGRATSDANGRFSLKLAGPLSACDHPALWAIGRGKLASTTPIDRDSIEGRPFRVVLSPSSELATFEVVGPDGRPIVGARVIPRRVLGEFADVPEAIADAASATTDRDGRSSLGSFRPEEILEVRVEAAGFGVQHRDLRDLDGLAGVGTRGITLRAAGKVSGRVMADDLRAVGGLVVRVATSGEGRGRPDIGTAEVVTEASGRFEIPAVACGSVTVHVVPRAGSPELPDRVVRRTLEAGRSLEVEISLRRGVKVSGLAVDALDGRPIAGVNVSVMPSGPSGPIRARTDDLGRFEAFVPSGLVTHRISSVPSPYLCPPLFVGPRPVEVPPAMARFELPRILLARGSDIRGSVRDRLGRPVAGAIVHASWTMFDGRLRAPMVVSATSRGDGSFELGPVATDAEVSLVASSEEASSDRPIAIRPGEGKVVALVVVEADAAPLEGRVVGRDGRGLLGASVRIWSLPHPIANGLDATSPVRLADAQEWKTDRDGRFRTTFRYRRDREYLAVATREGQLTSKSRPTRPGSAFPDLVLAVEPNPIAIEGRARDRLGRPVAGVRVWTSADGPRRVEATTGIDGGFRLAERPDHGRFVFAEADGYRFLGRSLGTTLEPIELTLTRLDEEPETSMVSLRAPSGDLPLARQVLAPYADRVLTEGDHASRFRTLEVLARVDPRRVLALVDAREVEDAWFADHLRHVASCSLADSDPIEGGRMAIVGRIRDLEWRALAALDAAAALPEAARALQRDCIEQALRDSRAIPGPVRQVVALARVADRLFALGDADRAAHLLEEARPLVESLATGGTGGRARVEFAQILARVDPTTALALTEEILDPVAFDRCRIEIARQIAARDPAGASRVLESLRDPKSMGQGLPALCHALAPVDPNFGRRLIARERVDDPCLPPYALGMMALAVSGRDKAIATTWLRESFLLLANVVESDSNGTSNDPASVAAALLPVAERIDPKLVPELLWKAVSLHERGSTHAVRTDALVALMVSRYDRDLARRLLGPIAERATTLLETDLAPFLAASVAIDPALSWQLVEALPEAPGLTYHHLKNQARLELAASLAWKGANPWDAATARFLRLWTESTSFED